MLGVLLTALDLKDSKLGPTVLDPNKLDLAGVAGTGLAEDVNVGVFIAGGANVARGLRSVVEPLALNWSTVKAVFP